MSIEVVYRGCMREQTVFGVPMVPLLLCCGSLLLFSFLFSWWLAITIPIAFVYLTIIYKIDEDIFTMLPCIIKVRLMCFQAGIKSGKERFSSSSRSKR